MTMAQMYKLIVVLMCFVSLAVSDNDQVRHLIINDANLIETSHGYAMNSPTLERNNIKTVASNGDSIVLTAPDCKETHLTGQQLSSMPDYEQILSSAKMELYSAESNHAQMSNTVPTRSGVSRFSLNDQMMSSSFHGQNMNTQSFTSNDWSIIKYGESNVWLRKPNMPDNINRIFVTNDNVAFIYNTGQVRMKPVICLEPAEQQLIQNVRTEIQQAQGQLNHNMRQFKSRIRQMQDNLNQRIRNIQMQLQQNLHNMNMNMNMHNMFSGSNSYNPFYPYASVHQQPAYGTNGVHMMQNGGFGSSVGGYPAASAFSSGGTGLTGAFGNNFPFGPNNSPFSQGFPFG